jgi:hypothetical protein
MARRRKYAQYYASGCRICGDKTVGRGIAKHLQGRHGIKHPDYKKCFESGKVIVDELVQTDTAEKGSKKVVHHVLVRRFVVPVQKVPD